MGRPHDGSGSERSASYSPPSAVSREPETTAAAPSQLSGVSSSVGNRPGARSLATGEAINVTRGTIAITALTREPSSLTVAGKRIPGMNSVVTESLPPRLFFFVLPADGASQ